MTMSKFDLLRADLAGLRTDLDKFRSDTEARFGRVDVRLERLEAKIDEKPGAATIYQASLTTFAGMFAVMIGTGIVLKTLSIIP
jgi:hypothetical protein